MTESTVSSTETNGIPMPPWWDGHKLNEVAFCNAFIKEHPMISVGDTFFTVDGRLDDEAILRQEIYTMISPYVTGAVSKRVHDLVEVLRLQCYTPSLPLHTDRIHVANGTLFLNGTFTEAKEYCRNRLPVTFNPDADVPKCWLDFLMQLLTQEDIVTLQEFMGYCLIPSTKGQKMLFLIGQGGEGKSRIGIVMRRLLGSNMNTGSIAKVETQKFARADLEHILVMVDDDMKLEALPQTNNIKAIITAEQPMDLEKKGKQSYQGDLYVRFMVFGNEALQALYDRSAGFFRRQIILTTKERDPDRIDDPYLAEKLCAEAEGIFYWAFLGLRNLIANNYRFTISERAQQNLSTLMHEGNPIPEFLSSEGYIHLSPKAHASSGALFRVYRQWCDDNATPSFSQKSFCASVKQLASQYGLQYTNKIPLSDGRIVRGFTGVSVLLPGFGK